MTANSIKDQISGPQSSNLTTLLDRNWSFAHKFEAGGLTIRPRMSTIILICVDSRVDPAHVLGLELGDAVVICNAGGRVTPAVLGDLAVLGVLAANMPGAGAMQPELVVIQHTDYGMSRLAVPAIREQVANKLGLSDKEVTTMAITDPVASVRKDIEQLRQTPGTPDRLVVFGFVYDVTNGAINQVVSPAPLRAAI